MADDETGAGSDAASQPLTSAGTTEGSMASSSSTTTTTTTMPKKRMGKGGKITLGVLGAVILVAVVLVLWLLNPIKLQAYDEPVSSATREQNTILYGAVVSLWIESPYVEVAPERAYVAYDWEQSRANASWVEGHMGPSASDDEIADETVSRDDMQRMIIGSAAEVLEGVASLEIAQFDHLDNKVTWKVQMADVEAYFGGSITLEEFEGRIQKS